MYMAVLVGTYVLCTLLLKSYNLYKALEATGPRENVTIILSESSVNICTNNYKQDEENADKWMDGLETF